MADSPNEPISPLGERGRRALLQRLESLHQAGVGQLPTVAMPTVAIPTVAGAVPPVASRPSPQPPNPSPPPEPMPPEEPAEDDVMVSTAATLEVLQQEVAACTLCEELVSTRTQTVFGVGNPQARLCFLGEAPGADEDRLGEPFVGRAGKLLDKIIEACTLKREEVYILNNLKCRPPNNRNPSPDESKNCSRYLIRQLELINPEYICCLGAIAAQNLLQTTTTIGRLRGKVHDYRGIKVVCTYHPAYLLRNPSAKKDTWEDMKMLMKHLGVDL